MARVSHSFESAGKLLLRIFVGIAFIPHGWMKLNPSGPMGGPAGFSQFLTQLGVPLPLAAAWLVALLESVGAALLIVGLGTRLVALALAIDMAVAILAVKVGMQHVGLIGVPQGPSGFELEWLFFAGSAALVFLGAGHYSVDSALRGRKEP